MPFHRILSKDSIFIDSTAQSKTAVLYKASQLLSQLNPQLDMENLFDAFWKREAMGSTSIGHGIILPHIRTELIDKTSGCFLKLLNPVHFDAVDKQPIDLVLALVVPQDQTNQHLELLAQIISHFSNSTFRKACRNAEDQEALYSVLMQNKNQPQKNSINPTSIAI